MNTGLLYLQGKNLYAHNDKKIGEIFPKEDGYYDWWPEPSIYHGYWPSYMLRAIADLLDEINEPLDTEIKEYFDKHPVPEDANEVDFP